MALPSRLNGDELERVGFKKVSPYKAHHVQCFCLPERIVRPYIDAWKEYDRAKSNGINDYGPRCPEGVPSPIEAR